MLRTRLVRALLVLGLVGGQAGCGPDTPPAPPAPAKGFTPTAAQAKAHNAALALLGRFAFEDAVDALDVLVKDAPGWDDARVNLAIALLNTQDEPALDRAQAELGRVLARDPGHLRAATCSGLIHLYRGQAAAALPLLERVAKADPEDAYALAWVGSTLKALDRNAEAVEWFKRAWTKDPYMQSAYYEAFQALQALDRVEEGLAYFEASTKLEKNPLARLAQFKYTRMGPKATASPGPARVPGEVKPVPAGGYFEEAARPVEIEGGPVPWAERPGPITIADIDGDGRVDAFLVGARATPAGPRGLVLFQTQAGFRADLAHPLGEVADVNAALWGDLDNDGRVDVYLCRRGENRLLLQKDGGRFEDVTALSRSGGGPWNTVDGLLADLDHDGDLDVYCVNADEQNELLSNNLDGTFRPLDEGTGVGGDGRPSVAALAADLDADRDLDLIVLHAEPPHELYWNDRLWAWRKDDALQRVPGPGVRAFLEAPARAAVAVDADGDGFVEVVTAAPGALTSWKLRELSTSEPTRLGKDMGSIVGQQGDGPLDVGAGPVSLLVGDFDADRRLDLLVAAQAARAHVVTGLGELVGANLAAGRFLGLGRWVGWQRLALFPRDPQRGLEVLRLTVGLGASKGEWREGLETLTPPRSAYKTLGLAFSGKHKEADSMRSNASGLGVRASVAVGTRGTVHHHLRNHSGPGQSLHPLFVGLGPAPALDYVSLDWPDGLLQTETGLEAGKVHVIEEVQRQTSSCPVLFCWDGAKHRFVTDLLGVGGIGFWVAPSTYAPPTPREHLLLPEGLPVAKDGRYVLKLDEPMEEACYLDHADLVAWDLPAGWQVVLDERLGVMGPMPTSAPRFFRRERAPSRAFTAGDEDATEAVRTADLKAAPVGPLDHRFLGRTLGSVLTLEFDPPLAAGPGEPMLVADGWVEYPYASTMFAAWQAGAAYEAPTLEARGKDGAWRVVQEQLGYPAGMPRRMSFPLVGLPEGTTALRLSTTYEIYWDRIAVAYGEPCPEARRTAVPRRKAALLASGFAKRTTGPQRLPHYDWEKRVPLWDCRHQRGLYTRLGDVEALLAATDDALCVFGPGEEVHLEYDAAALPPVPPGATRRFVLETTGWCKDSDLATKDGDTVGPYPQREGVTDTRARDALHAATLTRLAPPR
jgi:hypothetical protein